MFSCRYISPSLKHLSFFHVKNIQNPFFSLFNVQCMIVTDPLLCDSTAELPISIQLYLNFPLECQHGNAIQPLTMSTSVCYHQPSTSSALNPSALRRILYVIVILKVSMGQGLRSAQQGDSSVGSFVRLQTTGGPYTQEVPVWQEAPSPITMAILQEENLRHEHLIPTQTICGLQSLWVAERKSL